MKLRAKCEGTGRKWKPLSHRCIYHRIIKYFPCTQVLTYTKLHPNSSKCIENNSSRKRNNKSVKPLVSLSIQVPIYSTNVNVPINRKGTSKCYLLVQFSHNLYHKVTCNLLRFLLTLILREVQMLFLQL